MEPSNRPTLSPSPTLSDDSFEVAFTSRRHGYWSIYLVDEEGTQSKLLDITPVKMGPKRAWLDLLGQPEWSPSAPVLAFTCTPGRSEVCIAVENGSAVKQVTSEGGDPENYARWMPDGRRLVFSSFRDGSHDIYSVGADGTEERALVTGPKDQFGADVSADGKTLAYVERKPRGFTLRLAHLRPSGAAEVFETIRDASLPAWAPTGNDLVFTRHRNKRFADLYMISGDGSELERLTSSPGLDYWATWSPDGRMIAFTRDVDFDEAKKEYRDTDLHILDLDTRETRNITNDDTLNMQPAWRP